MAETTSYVGSASKIVSSEYLYNTIENLKENLIDAKADSADLSVHTSNTSNPHNVTKTQIGLSNVDNTADANKNVASAVKATQDASGNTITTQDTTYSDATSSASGLMTADMVKKLSGIADGAEVNVNADWNATTGDAMILNKPTIPSVVFESTALDLSTLT